MAKDDDFEPRLGRMRSRGAKRGRKYLHRVLAAANLARGGPVRLPGQSGRFGGSRIGRGAGVGRVLAARDRCAAFRRRRVVIKSRIVKLAGKGAAAARAHLRYVQRDGVTRDGEPGALYDAEQERVNGKAFLERGDGDRHQFRFIVSAEDGASYDDLKPLTRRLMARMEEDLDTRLDWVAVDHHNTGHPHSHIIVRGTDERGRDLIIARDYITHGMRERAAEIVQLDLGPRTDIEIADRLRAEIEQERLTSLDRRLIGEIDADRLVSFGGRNTFDQSLRAGRLRKLERLGLAQEVGQGRWRLAPDFEETLKRMGERGDIIKTMHREMTTRGLSRAAADQAIFDPVAKGVRPIVGRVIARGLSDEVRDRHYLIVDATDGRSHYVDVGKGEAVEALPDQAIVRITPRPVAVREADRTVAEIAEANGGRYDVDVHLAHDPAASEAFAEAHVRRLEAIRRLTGGVEREPSGTWVIAADHLERAAAHEARQARDRPVTVELLSPIPLERLPGFDGATWLDRELVAGGPERLRAAGFGREVRDAQAVRRQWLIDRELAEESGGRISYRANLVATLRRRELLRVASQLADKLGLRFVEAKRGDEVAGVLRRPVDLASGRFALIEKSKEFTLVPWRPVLERQIGKQVGGIMRSSGVSWATGRQRKGPTIS